MNEWLTMIGKEGKLLESFRECERDFGEEPSSASFLNLAGKVSSVSKEIASRIEGAISHREMEPLGEAYCKALLFVKDFLKDESLLALIDILLSSSNDYRQESRLPERCLSLWETSSSSWAEVKAKSPSRAIFVDILHWTIRLYPEAKEGLFKRIHDDLLGKKIASSYAYELILMFIKDEVLSHFLSPEQYGELIEALPAESSSGLEAEFLSFTLIELKDVLAEKAFPVDEKVIMRKIVSPILSNLPDLSNYFKHSMLRTIKRYMNELGTFPESDYSRVDAERFSADIEMLDSESIVPVEAPLERMKGFMKEKKLNRDLFLEKDKSARVLHLLQSVRPIDKEWFEKGIDDGYYDHFYKNGDPIISPRHSKKEIFLYIHEMMDVSYYPFRKTNSGIDYGKFSFKDIISKSPFLPPRFLGYKDRLIRMFLAGYMVDLCVKEIIRQFEEDLRHYLQNAGCPIFVGDDSPEKINMAHILNTRPDNIYKDALLAYMSEDYFATLTWVLADWRGYNLRNTMAHALEKSQKLYEGDLAIYAVLLILKLYF